MGPYMTKRVVQVGGMSSCCATTSTTANSSKDDTSTFVVCASNYPDIPKEEDLNLPLPKEKPKFDRIMKLRNTDGRPIQYKTWKPVRMYSGRDNIGTRNYCKLS
jgi:hypothetical protein